MSGSVPFLLCAALLLPAAATAADVTLYSKVGGARDLHPSLKPGTITSVSWKHGEDIVAEWVDPTVALGFWGVLKGRAAMDKSTGVLSITDMTGEVAGRYTVEVNSNLQTDGYLVKVLREVAVPKVEVQPLVCSDALENCSLVCDGDTAGAEPVTFFWRRGEEDWKEEGRTIQINKADARPEAFSCRMTNPVSSQDSTPRPNPFAPGQGAPVAAIVWPVVAITLLCVAAAAVAYVNRNREPVSGWVSRFRGGARRPAERRNGAADRPQTPPPPDPATEDLMNH